MANYKSIRVSALSTAGLLFGAAVIPAGSAFAAGECGTGATLVADGICEVTFLETPDSAWTPPAGITKLQALLVGAGGSGNHDGSDPCARAFRPLLNVELPTRGRRGQARNWRSFPCRRCGRGPGPPPPAAGPPSAAPPRAAG